MESWLTPELAALFFAQPKADRRHGYEAALIVVAHGSDDSDALVAALVHDVGKRHARLGVFARSAASIFIMLGLPLGTRMTAYRDHGLVGAHELGGAGAPALAVDFALHHQGDRPPSIAPSTWDLLVAADQPPKALASIRRRITSH